MTALGLGYIPLTVCPRCGGINGYRYRMLVVDHRTGSWGEDSEGCAPEVVRCPKNVSCVDCGARVEMKRAMGQTE